jgi:archaellum component FlaF (FlaF/FlaG flagellin family)
MENGLPALLVAAIMMLATVLMARGGFLGADEISQSLRASEMRYGEQNRTGLTVTSTAIDASGANITITVRNDGQTSLSKFSNMDVVVQYFGETGTRFDTWIPFTSGALSSNTWKLGTFTNDVFEPMILNSGESVDVLVRVNPVVGHGTTNLAVIATDRGVTTTATFAGPP